MADLNLEDYFNKLEHENHDEIIAIYNLIKSNFPQLEASIKWNAPNFALNGIDCITFRLAPKNNLQIILHRGAKVKDNSDFIFNDLHNIIEWKAKDRGVIDFKAQEVQQDKLLDCLQNWLKII